MLGTSMCMLFKCLYKCTNFMLHACSVCVRCLLRNSGHCRTDETVNRYYPRVLTVPELNQSVMDFDIVLNFLPGSLLLLVDYRT